MSRACFLAAIGAASATPEPTADDRLSVGASAAAAVALTASFCVASEDVNGAELATLRCSSASFRIMKPRMMTCSGCKQVIIGSAGYCQVVLAAARSQNEMCRFSVPCFMDPAILLYRREASAIT